MMNDLMDGKTPSDSVSPLEDSLSKDSSYYYLVANGSGTSEEDATMDFTYEGNLAWTA